MNNIDLYYEVLKEIKDNPYDYLRNVSLSYLHLFTQGYDACVLDSGICSRCFSERIPFDEFYSFVEKKYNVRLGERHYFSIIDFCEPNERKAFNKFFELLEEYKKNHYSKGKKKEKKALEGVKHAGFDELSIKAKHNMVLENMRKRPKLYFKAPSLKYLETYQNGYVTCAKAYQLPFDYYHGFDVFVQEKYEVSIQKSAFEIIEFFNFYEEDAFYKFFDLLDEYLGQKG